MDGPVKIFMVTSTNNVLINVLSCFLSLSLCINNNKKSRKGEIIIRPCVQLRERLRGTKNYAWHACGFFLGF